MKASKALHMVALGTWRAEATEDSYTVYDDDGDKLLHVTKTQG